MFSKQSVTRDEFEALERRVSALEAMQQPGRRFRFWPRLGRQTERYTTFESTAAATLYRDAPAADTKPLQPAFVSKSVRMTESLTDFSFAVKAQVGQGLVIGGGAFLLAASGALIFDWPWHSPFVVGATAAAVAWGALILHHREMLHRTVTQASKPKQDTRHTLNLNVSGGNPNNPNSMDRLAIGANVSTEQIKEWAAAVGKGATLGVHTWTGGGSLFSLGQYSALMTELERAGYCRPARGNIPRQLTKKGQAFVRVLSE